MKPGTKCLICGLVAFMGNVFLPFFALFTFPGIFFGHKALKELKIQPDQKQKRYAIIGLFLSYSIVITSLVIIALATTGIIQLR